MTTDRHPIDDAPLPDGLHDDEYPAADDDPYDDDESMTLCATCGIDFEPTPDRAAHCDDCFLEDVML